MSNLRFPPELLDHVVDHLFDTKKALKNCSLVSKSWISRTRKHLFANIEFFTEENLRSWKETFPDPSTSPARSAKTLFVGCPQVVTVADRELGGWITGFSRVVNLNVDTLRMFTNTPAISLVPFYKFSPVIKSLRVTFSVPLELSQFFNLVLSFPLLEDLAVVTYDELLADNPGDGSNRLSTVAQPSSPPMFTGSLELSPWEGMKFIAPRLLSLPGGLHFRKLTLRWYHKEDLLLTMPLVEECSHTLESLDISCHVFAEPMSASIDLSKPTKLGDVVFRPRSRSVGWVTKALQTITPKHRDLQQISVCVPDHLTLFEPGENVRQTIGEAIFGEWSDLDHLLVRFWESPSIRLNLTSTRPVLGKEGRRDFVGCLLPELTKRGVVNPIE